MGRQLEAEKTPAQIVENLYIRCLTRKPTEKEMKVLLDIVQAEPKENRQQILEDVFWALLNSREFVFNH